MLENNEIWKDIKGYEGLYQISNHGRVWSCRFQRVMKPYNSGVNENDNHYWKVDLCAKNGKRKREYVHRLVALMFLDKPEGCNVVNHIDGNKQNNHVENLEWVTLSENSRHSARVLGTKQTRRVRCITTGKEYNTMGEAKEMTGCNHIWEVCNGKYKQDKGLVWEYAD